jgi:histidyl-tRNA synthetase
MGIERMLLLLEAVGAPAIKEAADAYAIVPGPQALALAMTTCEALRAAGRSVLMHAAGAESWGSMKSQFRKADASGARYALVFGDDEVARGEVAIKPLREAGEQRLAPLADVASWASTLAA